MSSLLDSIIQEIAGMSREKHIEEFNSYMQAGYGFHNDQSHLTYCGPDGWQVVFSQEEAEIFAQRKGTSAIPHRKAIARGALRAFILHHYLSADGHG